MQQSNFVLDVTIYVSYIIGDKLDELFLFVLGVGVHGENQILIDVTYNEPEFAVADVEVIDMGGGEHYII